ncbi:putative hemolysin [Melghirimyces profundicolus]|uniref:Putative hemolysin n=1 Tax=Melghirimyces profundicolus TaxID=1242148 RepID=A0A2T6C7U9_9BACL|nr:GNAT family N-acyltransferase [Melghirimyces profundicolus]PTX64372.1 putative hemolysin [Melghirimyces profundicolus]
MTMTENARLTVKLARSEEELERVFRLRYEVFVEEGNATGLSRSSRMEQDRFDPVCDHLMVRKEPEGEVVGTYRLLPGDRAMQHGGFYSETEFDLGAFRTKMPETLELGRSCVAEGYRDGRVIRMLWSGIADYLRMNGYRYLIGCANLYPDGMESLNRLYTHLCQTGVLTQEYGIHPHSDHRIPRLSLLSELPDEKEIMRILPPLMKGYRWLGAKIGGDPAYDPNFGSYDFFVILHNANVMKKYRSRFLNR